MMTSSADTFVTYMHTPLCGSDRYERSSGRKIEKKTASTTCSTCASRETYEVVYLIQILMKYHGE